MGHPDRIEIRSLRVFGHHGVFDVEKRDGQVFVLDVVLEVDLSAAAASDALEDTVNYGTLAEQLATAVRDTRFDLIERLAVHLLDIALRDPRVGAAQIRVAKPEAPVDLDFDEVAVTLRRER